MLLWLQRAWSSDLRAAVIRGVKNVDVYKMSARIIICASSETTDPDDAFTSLLRRHNPIEQALFWELSNTYNPEHEVDAEVKNIVYTATDVKAEVQEAKPMSMSKSISKASSTEVDVDAHVKFKVNVEVDVEVDGSGRCPGKFFLLTGDRIRGGGGPKGPLVAKQGP